MRIKDAAFVCYDGMGYDGYDGYEGTRMSMGGGRKSVLYEFHEPTLAKWGVSRAEEFDSPFGEVTP